MDLQDADPIALLARTGQRLLLDDGDDAIADVFDDLSRWLGLETYFQYRVAPATAASDPHLVLERLQGLGEVERAHFARLAFGEALCGRVAVSREPLVFEDLPHIATDGTCGALASAGYLCYAGFPLLARGELVGTLGFLSRRQRRLPAGSLPLLQALCAQVGAALDRRRLMVQLQDTNAALQESQARFHHAARALHGIVYDADFRTGAVWRSDGLTRLLGYPPGAVPDTRAGWRALLHPDDLGRAEQALQHALSHGAAQFAQEYRLRHADGHWIWVWDHAVLLRDAAGDIERMVGISLSVDARKRAEANLLAERALLDAVLASAPVGFALFDRELRFRMVNERLADINGISVAAHLGRRVGELLPGLVDVARAAVDRVLTSGEPWLGHEIEGETPREPGVQRSWCESWYPVRGADGVCDTVAVVVEETTERRRMERERETLIAELRAADRRKDEFLAMLAHELRNPLAPIRQAVAVLSRPELAPGDAERVRAIVTRQVAHLTRLVDDLLEASRVTQGKISLALAPQDLVAAVHAGVELARPLLDERRHALALDLPPAGGLWVQGDAARLAQVVGNLLTNAAKYTDAGGTVGVRAWREGEQVRLDVTDTGIGIAPEALPHVFDLFAQAEQSLDRAQGGLGIGLALVKMLVEQHGGRVEAASAGPGRGSRFTLRLPALAPPAAAPAPTGPVAAPVARGRVLVVDDNADAAESLAMLLELHGFEARVAHDGPQALALVEDGGWPPAACLLDIGLPGSDGYTLARDWRRRPAFAGTCLVALTGYGRHEDRARAAEAGFDAHLTKPADPQHLVALLTERLGRAAALQAGAA